MRNVLTLVAGTGLAQAIPIAITPILTRIYSPADFGLFALFSAICAILTVIVTGRYELAVVVPEKDSEAKSIVYLAIFLCFIGSIVLFLIIFLFGEYIVKTFKNPELRGLLYWIPISIFFVGCFQSLSYWFNRKSNYYLMASSRVLQSGSMSTIHLICGFLKSGKMGLIFGQIFGQFLSFILLLNVFIKSNKYNERVILKTGIREVAIKYKRFPKFLILAHGFNTGSAQSPAIFLNLLFSTVASGYFMLIERVLQAPISLIGGSIGAVFRQEASFYYAKNKECKRIFIATFKKLLFLSFIPFILLFTFSKEIFVIAFGSEWAVASEYARVLIPMFFLRFLTSPLSAMFIIAEAQKLDLIWQIALFILTVTAFYVGYLFESLIVALIGFSSAYSIMFLINLYWSYSLAKGKTYNFKE